MTKRIKILIASIACCIAVLGFSSIAIDRLFSDMCSNEIFQESLAPGGNFKAILFQRDCGATTGFSTQISILPSDEILPNDGGNIFVVAGHPKETMIDLEWLSPTVLVVSRAAYLPSFKKETEQNGIKINYK